MVEVPERVGLQVRAKVREEVRAEREMVGAEVEVLGAGAGREEMEGAEWVEGEAEWAVRAAGAGVRVAEARGRVGAVLRVRVVPGEWVAAIRISHRGSRIAFRAAMRRACARMRR